MSLVELILNNWWILGAVLGSFLLWKFYGSHIIVKYAGAGLERWIERAYNNPESMNNEIMGKFATLMLAHILANTDQLVEVEEISEDGETKKRHKLHPGLKVIFQALEAHFIKAMGAAMGNVSRRANQAAKDFDPDNPMVGMEKAIPFLTGSMDKGGMAELMQMFQMFQKTTNKRNDDTF